MKRFKIDFSFYLFILCLFFSPVQTILFQMLFVLCIHEIGHFFFIFLFKVPILQLRLTAFGFIMELENRNTFFYQDILIYCGGVVSNFLFLWILPSSFFYLGLFYICFNLLPIYPLDGSSILKCILSYLFPYRISLILFYTLSGIILSILSILMVHNMDGYMACNFIYLWFLWSVEIKEFKKKYEAFVLTRYLNPIEFREKEVRFRYNLDFYLFRYHSVFMQIQGKKVMESDILRLKYEGN